MQNKYVYIQAKYQLNYGLFFKLSGYYNIVVLIVGYLCLFLNILLNPVPKSIKTQNNVNMKNSTDTEEIQRQDFVCQQCKFYFFAFNSEIFLTDKNYTLLPCDNYQEVLEDQIAQLNSRLILDDHFTAQEIKQLSEIKKQEQEQKERQKYNQELEEQIQKQNININQLIEEIEKLKQQIDNKNIENENMRYENKKLQQTIIEMKKENTKLQNIIDQNELENKQLKNEVKQLKDKQNNIEKQQKIEENILSNNINNNQKQDIITTQNQIKEAKSPLSKQTNKQTNNLTTTQNSNQLRNNKSGNKFKDRNFDQTEIIDINKESKQNKQDEQQSQKKEQKEIQQKQQIDLTYIGKDDLYVQQRNIPIQSQTINLLAFAGLLFTLLVYNFS